jgi:hypothetical protein
VERYCRRCKYWTACQGVGERQVMMTLFPAGRHAPIAHFTRLVKELPCLGDIQLTGSITQAYAAYNKLRAEVLNADGRYKDKR